MIKTKSSINDNTQPSQSDVISGAVSSNADGAATVVSQRTKDEITNINKNTSAAKNFIKRFKNSFDEDRKVKNFKDMESKLHEGFKMTYKGRGYYGLFNSSDGVLSFRINDHGAFGDNFKIDNADKNISIYVAYHKIDLSQNKY